MGVTPFPFFLQKGGDSYLNTTESELLKILSSSLFQTDYQINEEIDYNRVLKEARAQSVLGLVYPIVKDAENLRDEWKEEFFVTVMQNAAVEAGHAEIHRLFKEEKIPYVTLKGCASAKYYPEPSLRTMGDVDFLVAESDFERAERILLENGFEHAHEDSSERHRSFNKNNLLWELHKRISGIPAGDVGELCKRKISGMIGKAALISTDGGEFYIPDSYHHGMVILLHTVGHITSTGVGLRHVCDWAVFVNSMPEDVFVDMFSKDLKEIGLWKFTKLLTAFCSEYLGMPEKSFAADADKNILPSMMEDILSGGNFGKKDKDRYHGSMMMSSNTNQSVTKSLFQTLNNRARKRMPVVNKVPVLLPIGWAYVGVNHFVMIAKGERPKVKLKRTLKKTVSRRELIEEYKIFSE